MAGPDGQEMHGNEGGNDMSMVVGGFALVVALVAVWLATEAAKKVGSQNEELVKVHISGVKKGLQESNKAIKVLGERLVALEKEIKTLNKAGEAVPALKGEMEKIKSELSALDSSIPEKFRARQHA